MCATRLPAVFFSLARVDVDFLLVPTAVAPAELKVRFSVHAVAVLLLLLLALPRSRTLVASQSSAPDSSRRFCGASGRR